jgi:hypothetical protein
MVSGGGVAEVVALHHVAAVLFQQASWASVSTPSATAIFRPCAMAMMARVMAAFSESSGRPLMKLLSILSARTSKRFR